MEGVLLAGATVGGVPAAASARDTRATAPAQRRAASTDAGGVPGAVLGALAVVLLLAVGAWSELRRLPGPRRVVRRLLPHRGDR